MVVMDLKGSSYRYFRAQTSLGGQSVQDQLNDYICQYEPPRLIPTVEISHDSGSRATIYN